MIELKANITRQQWSDDFPPAAQWQRYFDSEAARRAGGGPYACQIITIRHTRWPEALWHLRLPEKVATDDTATTGAYQEDITWSRTDKGWMFRDLPLSELEGTVDASVSVDGDAVDYAMALVNTSGTTWPRALAWLCFNHSMATACYRYRNFVFRDNRPIETPSRIEQHYCVDGLQRDWWIQGTIEPDAGLIVGQCIDAAGEPFTVGIGADRTILLGQNPDWPCTDIGLFFGDVEPGRRSTVRGRIYFCRGGPEDLFRRYRDDFR